MTKEEAKAMRETFKPYVKLLKDKPVLVLVGENGGCEALDFWGEVGQLGKLRNVKVSWNSGGKNYIWSCKVSRWEGGWRRDEEQSSCDAKADTFWDRVATEGKMLEKGGCVVIMSRPELNETCRKVCKVSGIKCLAWNTKIGLIADGFEKEKRIGA